MKPTQISEHLFRFEDTCNVYLLAGEAASLLIDFGSGDALDELQPYQLPAPTDVLITHHHRDQGQGLAKAATAGLHIWAPYNEQDLFHSVDAHWQARAVFNNYNVRQDRFSLLEPVPLFGLLEDYAVYHLAGFRIEVAPTPGHTTGSLSLMVEVDGQKVAFTGDLIYAPGKLWSLAASQWSYNGGEGLPATVASLLDIQERQPNLLLPSHGAPIAAPAEAIDLTVARLVELMAYRRENPHLTALIAEPYSPVTPHLLRSNQNVANTAVLLSSTGKALFIDFGYDFTTGLAQDADRASRRPWLYSLKNLKRKYGIQRVDVVLPTHYHDDHVAGINLLRRVEGTQSWIPANFAPILANPARYNLPCLWYDPIPADRVLPLGQPISWEEYTLTVFAFPGHTRYAVAIFFVVDGQRVLVVGDQYQSEDGLQWNYVYQNRFSAGDFHYTAGLYAQLRPDLVLSGHWEPLWVKPGYFDELHQRGEALERMHNDLLPDEIAGFGVEGFGARIEPYQAFLHLGEKLELEVEVKNPTPQTAMAEVRLVLPSGWKADPALRVIELAPGVETRLSFRVTPPPDLVIRRARLAVDLTVGGHFFGQQAEALVTIQ